MSLLFNQICLYIHIYIYIYRERERVRERERAFSMLNRFYWIKQTLHHYRFDKWSIQVILRIVWHVNGVNSKRFRISPKYFRSHLEPFIEEIIFEMINSITSHMYLINELEESQVVGTKENNFTGCKKKNWREKWGKAFQNSNGAFRFFFFFV